MRRRTAKPVQDLGFQFLKDAGVLLGLPSRLFGKAAPMAKRRRRFLMVRTDRPELRVAAVPPANVQFALRKPLDDGTELLHVVSPKLRRSLIGSPRSFPMEKAPAIDPMAIIPAVAVIGSTNLYVPCRCLTEGVRTGEWVRTAHLCGSAPESRLYAGVSGWLG
ncbi:MULTISPECIES: hypothetical protein [Azospirillum]|uniref:Uncharacterized protein n=1 Tax=Azospirillum brasilense TaxID=192 RepID=A0ABU4P9S3_AZOBR|nr:MULTISPECIES: hypothetical protein [Azospirillum]MDW7554155.1 hypothetical protein [Azospirillum brasilense]MDW7593586.1 hypothetical protein [Azospirillum brasilense]MDW7627171.1 hypothetical protein [Azospirillum brasilense]MDX5953125.1 hypothetical protein [Azospirillum brasilense]